jgi:hypothetical protein
MRIRLMVVGVVCLAVAVGSSIAWAAVGDGGTVKTCVSTKKGSLRAVDGAVACKPGKELAFTFYTKTGADSAFLGATAKAADSDKLDGIDSTGFLGTTAKAADSDKLDGINSTGFLGANAKAADSNKLDGLDSTAFLDVSGRVNSDGTVTGARGGLIATALDAPGATLFLLQYPGFDPDSPPIVVLTPVGLYSETGPPTAEVIPSDDSDLIASLGGPPPPGIVVRVQTPEHKEAVGGFNVVIKP